MAARMPMMATTIINSISVKPRWLPRVFLFLCQKPVILSSSDVWAAEGLLKEFRSSTVHRSILGANRAPDAPDAISTIGGVGLTRRDVTICSWRGGSDNFCGYECHPLSTTGGGSEIPPGNGLGERHGGPLPEVGVR